MDEITGDNLFKEGISLGDDHGKIRVVVNQSWDEDLMEVFQEDIPDVRLLNSALRLQKIEPGKNVILVTLFLSLEMFANAPPTAIDKK